MKKFRVGFIIDNSRPSLYATELIKFVLNNDYFDDPVIISEPNNKYSGFFHNTYYSLKKGIIKFIDNVFKELLFLIIKKIETKIVLARFPSYKISVDFKNLEKYKTIKINGVKSSSCQILEFTKNEISLIAAQELDCIIHCGSQKLDGEILNSSKFGVFSSVHPKHNEHEPNGFWEVLNKNPCSEIVIHKLNQDHNKIEILCKGNLMTSNLWLVNYFQMLFKSNSFFINLLSDLAINRKLKILEETTINKTNSFRKYTSLIFAKYILLITMPKIINNLISRIFSPKLTRYSIAYSYHADHSKLLSSYVEIENPKGRFLADPFVLEHEGSDYIFVEDFFFNDNKGRISVIRIDKDKYEFLDVILEESFHLSFPFVFKEGESIYMIPESHENHDIRLYKCLDFPYNWKLEKILMSDINAADTMLIKREHTWFMLTNICSAEINDHQSELHIFYSNELESSHWEPLSSGNPVIFDSSKARNGGLFYFNDKMFRVNQVHGQAHYGKSFDINEITLLSKDNYDEKPLLSINPDFKKNIIATHHFNANNKIAAVDFVRQQRERKALIT